MDFSPDIMERIETLTKKNLEKKKIIQDFIGLLQARAELEEYYSRGIERIADSLTKLIHGKDGLKDIFITLKSYFHMQTEQTRTLARQLKNDVIFELDQHIQTESNWQKQMQIYQKKHSKEIRRNIDSLNQLRDEYIGSLQEEMKCQQNQQIQRKYNYRQAEIKLQNFIQYYNQYLDQYFQDIANVQDTFENLEIERRKKVQDSAMKFLMFEISVIRNLQYDLSGISAKLEAYNPKSQLNELFKEQSTDKPMLSKLQFENYRQFIHQQLSFKPQEIQQKKKKPIFEQSAQSQLSLNKVDLIQPTNTQIYMKLFQSALFNNIITDQTINKLDEMLEESSPMIYVDSFEKVLKLKINSEEFEDSNEILVNPEGYIQLIKLTITLLDHCNKKNSFGDALVKILNLSKQIYKIVNPPEANQKEIKLSLYDGLSTHNVLSNSELWLQYSQPFYSNLNINNSVLTDNYIVKDQIQQQIEDFILQLELVGCKFNVIEVLRNYFNTSDVKEYDLL